MRLAASPALLTDLYELSMAAAYVENGRSEARASFELFIRELPAARSFLVAAGLAQALDYLQQLAFTREQIAFLRRHPMFRRLGARFFSRLADLRFTGDVWALPEGTLAFAGEPLLRVEAPLIEAQIVETFLLATLQFQTLVASKAARAVAAAAGRPVVEFGARRAHSPAAGLYGARAAFIGGCLGSSLVEAGAAFGIPTFGTFAHSLVLAWGDEAAAFTAFWTTFREKTTFLLDTYDTLRGAARAAATSGAFAGVRLDSGDLAALARQVRRILDHAGHREARIMASGDLDEYRIAALVGAKAPIDSFGVGTHLVTSYDAPALSAVYKLVEMDRDGRPAWPAKLTGEKINYPGRKQIYRFAGADGRWDHDLLAGAEEPPPAAQPLLRLAMRRGHRLKSEPLSRAQTRCREQITLLPPRLRRLEPGAAYPVRASRQLRQWLRQAKEAAAQQP